MMVKNYDNLDLLTAKLWSSFLIGFQHGQTSLPLKIGSLQVAKMLELREEAALIIEDIKLGLFSEKVTPRSTLEKD